MRLSAQENFDLTRVGSGTVLGDMLLEYWHPALRAGRLEPDGDPQRVRLLGRNFVAFRASDGRVGFLDEGCPHRGASLALAHNSGNGLRCIFHGWKIDVSGQVVHVPTEQAACAKAFAAQVDVANYPVREEGGLIWVFLQRDKSPPKFPDFDFTHLPPERIDIRVGSFKVNWVQAMEAFIDSAHLGQLHRTSMVDALPGTREERERRMQLLLDAPAPRFEIEPTPYGFREGALRDQSGQMHVNLRQFVAPYYSFLPAANQESRILRISVPDDDEQVSQYFLTYHSDRPLRFDELATIWANTTDNMDDILGDIGGFHNKWHQDRGAMQQGHSSGFVGRHIFHEDLAVQESMGRIVDRTREHLGSSDTVIAYVRTQLLQTAYQYRGGTGKPWGLSNPSAVDYSAILSTNRSLAPGEDWRLIDPLAEWRIAREPANA